MTNYSKMIQSLEAWDFIVSKLQMVEKGKTVKLEGERESSSIIGSLHNEQL